MSEEQVVTPVPEAEPEFKSTLTPEQLAAAIAEISGRSFSGRHPELGKMINCPVHNRRHRQFEYGVDGCKQKFTNQSGDYEYFEEGEDGKLVPLERTAMNAAASYLGKPSIKSIVGAAQFSKKRFHPHPSKIKLLFIERVRVVFERLGFELVDSTSEEFKALTPEEQKAKAEKVNKDLHRARVVAAREIRKEKRLERKRRRKLGIR